MKNIVILGSTGSIGTQTLDIVKTYPEELKVTALAAGHDAAAMEKQVRAFAPKLAVMYDEKAAEDLKSRIRDTETRVLHGMEGLLEAAVLPEADIVVGAVVGMIGIRPTLAAIRAGHDVALANKETLVTAGHIITRAVRENGVRLLPVDSEHSAIFQCMQGEEHRAVEKILLTASGGPFLGKKREELENMTAAEALKHPNWSMGPKVTIDSSTLVNKGLEVMEAHWLFDVSYDDIQVLVQPKSIVHSMVQFTDGAVIAQLGIPDMHLPIQYALFYPHRMPLSADRLDFAALKDIHFEAPDTDTFPGLSLAFEAAKTGGTMPTVFNAANEEAVKLFLRDEIRYPEIIEVVKGAMENHRVTEEPTLEQIFQAEEEAREEVLFHYERK